MRKKNLLYWEKLSIGLVSMAIILSMPVFSSEKVYAQTPEGAAFRDTASYWVSSFGNGAVSGTSSSVVMASLKDKKKMPMRYMISYYPDKDGVTPEIKVIEFSEGQDIKAKIKEIKRDPAVRLVEPDGVRTLMDFPNDKLGPFQWGLKNIEAVDAWKMAGSLEKNVVVAVIDSGVDQDHPDLVGRIIGGVSYIDGVQGTAINDLKNHGTIVAGIIAANTGNSIGVSGVSGDLGVSVLPINIFGSNDKTNSSDFIWAINYAIEQNVDVINLSMAGTGFSQSENKAIQTAINAGIIVVAASGNIAAGFMGGTEVFPACYDGVISVGSIDNNNIISSFSNYNSKVTVVAPGRGIYSTNAFGGYSSHNGTSFAAPVVAAMAGVYKGEHPTSSPAEIKKRFQDSATDMGAVGRDDYYGYGRVDFKIFLRTDLF